MRRSTVLSLIAIVSVLLSASCGTKDSDGPRTGAWRLTGEDTNAVSWTATFTLARTSDGYSGTFAWKRNGADAGVESFTGAYDATAKTITLRGQQVTGNVVTANYAATVSADLERMTDGRWTSDRGPSGTWHAERIGD